MGVTDWRKKRECLFLRRPREAPEENSAFACGECVGGGREPRAGGGGAEMKTRGRRRNKRESGLRARKAPALSRTIRAPRNEADLALSQQKIYL